MNENDGVTVKLWRPGDESVPTSEDETLVFQVDERVQRINQRISERMSPGASNGVAGGLAKPLGHESATRAQRRAGQRKPRLRRRGMTLVEKPWTQPVMPPQVYDVTKSGRVRGRA